VTISDLMAMTTTELRERAERVRAAFANYIDGTGRDAHEIALALPAILDELDRLRRYECVRELDVL